MTKASCEAAGRRDRRSASFSSFLRLASSSENAVGWTRLGVVASRQMQAKLGPDVTIEDPDYRLSRSLYRLN